MTACKFVENMQIPRKTQTWQMTVLWTEGKLHKGKIAKVEMDNKSSHMYVMKLNNKISKMTENRLQ
jgi:hypothetical protein